jgi:hypothetical protein
MITLYGYGFQIAYQQTDDERRKRIGDKRKKRPVRRGIPGDAFGSSPTSLRVPTLP